MKTRIYIFISLILICLLQSCITNKQIDELLSDKTFLYPVSYNGKWGYTNENGELVIPCKYDSVQFFSLGLAVVKQKEKYGYLKTNGDWHIEPEFDSATNFDLYCASVVKNGKPKRINRKNKKCDKTYYRVGGWCNNKLLPRAKKELHSTQKKGKKAIIYNNYYKDSITGEVAILKDTTQYVFDEVIEFSYGKLLIKKDNKFGLYNINGINDMEIIAEEFEVFEIEKVGIVDTIIFQFDEIKVRYQTFAGLPDGYEVGKTPFRIGEYWGLLDSNGEIIAPKKYLDIVLPIGNLVKVEFEEGKFGYVDIYKNKEYFKRKTTSNNR